MRISDWSADVCSSDLTSSACGVVIGIASAAGYALNAPDGALPAHSVGYVYLPAAVGVAVTSVLAAPLGSKLAHAIGGQALKRVFALFPVVVARSEEHTSELQSLMRHSYAVCCLKKKNTYS